MEGNMQFVYAESTDSISGHMLMDSALIKTFECPREGRSYWDARKAVTRMAAEWLSKQLIDIMENC